MLGIFKKQGGAKGGKICLAIQEKSCTARLFLSYKTTGQKSNFLILLQAAT